MNIVGIAACVAGVAHTYIAREKLIKAAQLAGHTISVETQGQIGTQDELTMDEIEKADVVILAVDTSIRGRDRFDGKKIVEVPTETAIHSSGKLIKHIEENIKV